MKEGDTLKIAGHLHIIERNVETGEVVGEYEENNVVLTQGKGYILRGFANAANNIYTAKTIKLGIDVGDGDILNPQEANSSMTEADQQVVYSIDPGDFFSTSPSPNSIRFLASVSGSKFMESFPGELNAIYTSAAIYTVGDKAVTYKRFPARTMSAMISVDIIWTLTIL